MEAVLRDSDQQALAGRKKELQKLVMAGLDQVKKGKTKEFCTVCDRLEKKYGDEKLSD